MKLDKASEALARAYLAYVTPEHFDPPAGRLAGLLNDAAAVGLCSDDALVFEPLCVELARVDLVPGEVEYSLTLSLKARACASLLAARLGVGRDRLPELHAAAVRVGLQRLQPPKREGAK